jgi:hypothetical protein
MLAWAVMVVVDLVLKKATSCTLAIGVVTPGAVIVPELAFA